MAWTQAAHANTPDDKLCPLGERFFDDTYQNVFNKKIYKIDLMETYTHYVHMHKHCTVQGRLNNYIIRISQIITNRDLESHIESQLSNKKTYKNMMLFLEGLSGDVYKVWQKKKHPCNSAESMTLLKLNRLGNIFSHGKNRTDCPECSKLLDIMDNRVSKTYACDDALWYGE
jgi:hypothetical protein